LLDDILDEFTKYMPLTFDYDDAHGMREEDEECVIEETTPSDKETQVMMVDQIKLFSAAMVEEPEDNNTIVGDDNQG